MDFQTYSYMKDLKIPIVLATAFLLFYTISAHAGMSFFWVMLMFSLSPLVVIWLAVHILKYGEPTTKTWEEGFRYEDKDV